MLFRRIEFFPSLFLIFALSTFLTLGSWQLQRLAWKNQVIAASEKAQNLPALTNFPESFNDEIDQKEYIYRRVRLSGKFIHEQTIHLIGRQQGVDSGFYLVTPFILPDKRIILVNRGFSPLGKQSLPENIVTIEGILRAPRAKRTFVPENMPERNIWTYEDLNKISEIIGKNPLPLIVEEVGTRKDKEFPIPSDGKIIFRNDHLGYAITWFSLAIVSIVMFGIYYRKR